MTTIALHMPSFVPDWWMDKVLSDFSDFDIRKWPESLEVKDEIEYVITLKPEPESLTQYPNLKAIFLTSAGADHILSDSTIPPEIPLCRLVHGEMATRMAEYLLSYVLKFHRSHDKYAENQQKKVWDPEWALASSDLTVGILGAGQLGMESAKAFNALGFNTKVWSRSKKNEPGIKSFVGDKELSPFLDACSYVACCLPFTPETQSILGNRTFSMMQEGVVILNVARGSHIVEADLLENLESGHIKAAVLDVFQGEPLKEDHPFWTHPNVIVTPHISTTTHPRMVKPAVEKNIKLMENGKQPLGLVDRSARY